MKRTTLEFDLAAEVANLERLQRAALEAQEAVQQTQWAIADSREAIAKLQGRWRIFTSLSARASVP